MNSKKGKIAFKLHPAAYEILKARMTEYLIDAEITESQLVFQSLKEGYLVQMIDAALFIQREGTLLSFDATFLAYGNRLIRIYYEDDDFYQEIWQPGKEGRKERNCVLERCLLELEKQPVQAIEIKTSSSHYYEGVGKDADKLLHLLSSDNIEMKKQLLTNWIEKGQELDAYFPGQRFRFVNEHLSWSETIEAAGEPELFDTEPHRLYLSKHRVDETEQRKIQIGDKMYPLHESLMHYAPNKTKNQVLRADGEWTSICQNCVHRVKQAVTNAECRRCTPEKTTETKGIKLVKKQT